MPAAPRRHGPLLGEALRALRDLQDRRAAVRGRRPAGEGAGEEGARAHALGVELAASVGAQGETPGRRRPAGASARLGARRGGAQENPRGQPGRALPVQVIRLGIVGLGMAVTPHAKSFLDLKDRAEVAYAYSRSPARRANFAERFPFPQCDRLETILEDRSVDAVLALTPPNTHLELVERCAAAGKHVLLEKPLERSTERALRLVEAAEAAGVKLGVVFQHRFREASEHLRGL